MPNTSAKESILRATETSLIPRRCSFTMMVISSGVGIRLSSVPVRCHVKTHGRKWKQDMKSIKTSASAASSLIIMLKLPTPIPGISSKKKQKNKNKAWYSSTVVEELKGSFSGYLGFPSPKRKGRPAGIRPSWEGAERGRCGGLLPRISQPRP